MLLVFAGFQVLGVVDIALCEEARQNLPDNPEVQAFTQCARGSRNLSASCCRKLLPFVRYYDCLDEPIYRAAAEGYLRGVTTVQTILDQTGAIHPTNRHGRTSCESAESFIDVGEGEVNSISSQHVGNYFGGWREHAEHGNMREHAEHVLWAAAVWL
ncbi:hypothetical protein VOLCADRAFT_95954 [Volvox carteri f. nagariensis]|uniref:Uncharacterized protein n=1 Tax=Volvox carteri f. nagariensis TaxID=3068 RepID=D8U8U0_VOLCA|nr:uncharacterized protein VOLCADRAFT_95954 [Volvox carteri f. nagariensis]EFJ43806.1 hypothetical protein VOLCADRAFT_95954 [Volvox carteri f. nagariensis]|eukprot:XP_002955052.1 hypothetical protein VOLCADRAFT_95954 [Volvox carteri f. nagariensis]